MRFSAWLALFLASACVAQTPPRLESIEVSASLRPDGRAAADVVVIDRATIERLQPLSVAALLRRVPGLHLDRGDFAGGVSSLYLRGADPNYTLVLVDGVRMNDPSNSRGGSFDFNELDPGEIERIEIVRGPLSALYGADAIAGVIQIFTAAPRERAHARIESGSRGSHAFAAGLRLGTPAWLRLGRRDSGSTAIGATRLDQVSAGARWDYADGGELRIDLRHGDSRQWGYPEDSGGVLFALRRQWERRDAEQDSAAMSLSRLPTLGWGYRVQLQRWQRQQTEHSPGVAPGRRDPFGLPASRLVSDSVRQHGQAMLSYRQPNYGFSVAFEQQREQGELSGRLDFPGFTLPTAFSERRDNHAVIAEAQYWSEHRWSGLLGLRHDRSAGGDVTSPRASLNYRYGEDTSRVQLGWGKGYKLPSLFALGHPLIGNRALRPEFSRSLSAGIEQVLIPDRAELRLDAFVNHYRDAIDFEPGPPPQLVNRSQLRARGAELGVAWRAAQTLHGQASLSRVQTRVEETGAGLRNRPRQTAHLNLHWQFTATQSLSVDAVHVGRQRDSSIPTGDRNLPAYHRLDLRWQRELGRRWQLHVAIDNLFDRRYQEYLGAPVAGRGLRVGLAWGG